MHASSLLKEGAVYTRDALKDILSTQDATINTGVFRPAGFASVLLFVTKEKTKDRRQYVDHLEGDVLYWQGQSKGRTDPLVIKSRQRGLELLVFYRERKYEHDGAGFRYEGQFSYDSHKGKEPANFLLRRDAASLDNVVKEVEAEGFFNPTDIEDARRRTVGAIIRRQGQPAFRKALLRAYSGRCAFTNCEVAEVLEAAHIVPYQGPQTNHVSNGLLLRADLHTMFDLGLVAIDPDLKRILIVPALQQTNYGKLNNHPLRLPALHADHPSEEALRLHRTRAGL
jgi:putative restriction endonuclease